MLIISFKMGQNKGHSNYTNKDILAGFSQLAYEHMLKTLTDAPNWIEADKTAMQCSRCGRPSRSLRSTPTR